MSTPTPDAGVRRARPDDAPAVGAVHAASWLADYTELLPRRAASVDAAALSESWQQAITAPPTPRHRVMVATAGADVVGFVAFAPSADGDADPAADAEVVTLLVDPGAQRRGHGSRLLNATVDTLREQGAARVRIWVPEVDQPRLAFVQAAGFAADGAARVLDAAGDGTTTVREVRLSAAITPER
ncbi:MAG: GNAT family N-acetyltransferase [Actinomycetota bacterium]